MFNYRRWLVITVLSISVLCITSIQVVSASDKVAFVNVDKLFDEYQKTLELNEKLDKEIAGRQADREQMVEEVRRLKDELVLISDENRKEKQDQIDAKIRDLQQFDEKTREELAEKRNDYMREILVELDEEVKKFGSEKGYDFIYNGRLLLYQNAKYDITDQVLKKINDNYKK